jgi:transglutaminase-like putative cysteine protease
VKTVPGSAPAARGERLALTAVYAAALWAFAVGRSDPGAWLFLAPAAIAPFVRPRAVPPAPGRVVLLAARLAVGGVILFGAANSLYPVISDGVIAGFATVSGYGLLALGVVFLAGTWTAGSGLLPVSVALLAVACLDPMAPVGPPVAAAGLAGFGYLLASGPPQGAAEVLRRGRTRRVVNALVLGAGAGALTLGILRLLPWAQPRVEAATAGLFYPAYASTGLSEISTLGDIEQLALSPTVALRVWTRAPRRLRLFVQTYFTGRKWLPTPGPRRALVPLAGEAVAGPAPREWLEGIPGDSFTLGAVAAPAARMERTRIAPALRLPPGVLCGPAAPWLVRVAAPDLWTAWGVLHHPAEGPSLYGIVHGLDDLVEGAPSTPEPDPALLALPHDTDPRLVALARTLSEGEPPADERVARTLGYLAAHCRYSRAAGASRGSAQPVAAFVFETKEGYCDYFASAAAVLLRLQGVPTRYVKGYNVTDHDFVGGQYVVREANAHSWIDAYLPGRGWVEFDPTPAGQYAALHDPLRPSGLAAAWDALAARTAGLWIALRFGPARAGVAPLVLAALAVPAAVLGWRRWRRRAAAAARAPRPRTPGEPAVHVAPEIAALLTRADRLWARRGFPRPPHRAPLEHLRSLPARFGPDALAASRAAVECYYRARFGGLTTLPGEAEELARRLATLPDPPPA